MRWKSISMIGVLGLVLATPAVADITFYQAEGFRGRSLTTAKQIRDLDRFTRNGAFSAVVDGGRWEVCEDRDFGGPCVILRRGSYDSLSSMGVNGPIGSARLMTRPDDDRYQAPPPPMQTPNYEFRQRPHERIYEAPVTSVRAVVGPPDQRCWVERERVVEPGRPSAKGAIAGAIIGGILGHQLGDHRDAATAGGALAGAAIGANAGRGDDEVYDRDVRRCEVVPSGPPEFWEVAYEFRGVRHVVQMTEPPGRTILVNRNGEPRQ